MDLFWKKPQWEEEDRHLAKLSASPFKRTLPSVQLSPGVTMIRGPRQIGKSTWLKLLLKETLKKSDRCFFYSCEDLVDFKDLTELLRSQPGIHFFFLDEITFVEEWWRAIKKSVDSDRNIHFVLTGSNSYDLKRGLDFMPGRWSQGAGELFLLPMLFDEWLEMRRQAGWDDLERVEALKSFFQIGGFPISLTEAGNNGSVPKEAILIYQRWILGDVVKLGRQELFMKELLLHITKTICSSISLQGLAQKTQIMSYHTVQDYLSILEHAFALRTLFAYDPDADSFRFKKEKKYYFTDPIVYWAALQLAGAKVPENWEEQLAEMVAAEHLFREFPRLGYYSTRNGEVDFISGRDMAIEVKWSPVVGNLSKTYKLLNIANKKVWSQSNFLI